VVNNNVATYGAAVIATIVTNNQHLHRPWPRNTERIMCQSDEKYKVYMHLDEDNVNFVLNLHIKLQLICIWSKTHLQLFRLKLCRIVN